MTDPMQTVAQQGGDPIPGQTTPTTEADARTYVEEAAQQTNAGLSWADVENDIESVGDYLTDGTRRLLASTGLDGIAIEFSVGADVREAMQNPVDIPEQGDMHYHTPDAGPGFVHALIEAMTEW